MKKFLIILLGMLIALYVIARLANIDPEEQRPGLGLGGALANPQTVTYDGRKQIYVETRPWYGIPHSVTTTSWVVDGTIYVPCARCDGKRWPKIVAADPDVRLKIDGALYERRAVRIADAAERDQLLAGLARDGLPEGLAVFRMEMR